MAKDTKEGGLIMANPYEAEIKRKALAGIKLTNPTAQSTALYNSFKPPSPVNNSAAIDAEIKRKAGLGIKLSNATPESMAKYGEFQAAPIKAQFQSDLDSQLAALAGEREAAKQAADFQVAQNSRYLQEQLGALKEQNTLDVNAAQELQNRRGGFYSGGLDYQLGNIGRGYAQAQGGLERDIADRNAQIMSQYGNQANAIASQIAKLQKTAPDILRNKIEEYLQNQSSITGMYRGAPTYDARMAEQSRSDRLAQQQFENNLATNKYNLDLRQENRIASGGGGSSGGGKGSSGGGKGESGGKVSTNQFNDTYLMLNKRYGVANYKTDKKTGKYITNPDGSAIVTYTNTKNPEQRAKIVLEILNAIPDDDQAIKMLNKFGITEAEAEKLTGG